MLYIATGCNLPIAFANDTGHLISLIFKLVIALVFIVMNVLYQLFWKNNAKADYFQAIGITDLPEDKEEYVARPAMPHACKCGYDLQANQDFWLHVASEDTPRCPGCEREICVDELDLSATTPPALAGETPAPAPIVDLPKPIQAETARAVVEVEEPPPAPIKPPVEVIGALV